MSDIGEIEADASRREICQRKTLCKTIGGQDCEILTITNKADLKKDDK